MSDVSLILLAAGNSSRFGLPTKKQWLYIDEEPLWLYVAKRLESYYDFAQIVVVGNEKELKLMQQFANYIFTQGGSSRQESLKSALNLINTPYVVVNDVARCCIDNILLKRILEAKKPNACVAPALKVTDTTYYDSKPIDREKLLRVQTPQLSHTQTLKNILNSAKQEYTDESSTFYANNKEIIFVQGSPTAQKLTYKDELKNFKCLKPPSLNYKVGFGIDIHPFENNKDMYLCGAKIDSLFGFRAHSDGDVAIHALIDALLGAANLGDIGELFPDTDKKYKNINSKELLKEVINLVRGVGYEVVNCDLSIVAQVPKISPYKKQMQESLASVLNISKSKINIKATTAEKLGFIGREEGVAVYATVTLNYYRWDRI